MTRKADYMVRATRNATTFDNTFQTLGTPLAAQGLIIKIVNNSDTLIDISINGGTDEHDVVPATSSFVYDMRSNAGREKDFAWPQGTQFSIRGAAAGTGLVYLIGIREEA